MTRRPQRPASLGCGAKSAQFSSGSHLSAWRFEASPPAQFCTSNTCLGGLDQWEARGTKQLRGRCDSTRSPDCCWPCLGFDSLSQGHFLSYASFWFSSLSFPLSGYEVTDTNSVSFFRRGRNGDERARRVGSKINTAKPRRHTIPRYEICRRGHGSWKRARPSQRHQRLQQQSKQPCHTNSSIVAPAMSICMKHPSVPLSSKLAWTLPVAISIRRCIIEITTIVMATKCIMAVDIMRAMATAQ